MELQLEHARAHADRPQRLGAGTAHGERVGPEVAGQVFGQWLTRQEHPHVGRAHAATAEHTERPPELCERPGGGRRAAGERIRRRHHQIVAAANRQERVCAHNREPFGLGALAAVRATRTAVGECLDGSDDKSVGHQSRGGGDACDKGRLWRLQLLYQESVVLRLSARCHHALLSAE